MIKQIEGISTFALGLPGPALVMATLALAALLFVIAVTIAVRRIKKGLVLKQEIDKINDQLKTIDTIRDINEQCESVRQSTKEIMSNLEELYLNQAAFGQSLFDLNFKVDSLSSGQDGYSGM